MANPARSSRTMNSRKASAKYPNGTQLSGVGSAADSTGGRRRRAAIARTAPSRISPVAVTTGKKRGPMRS